MSTPNKITLHDLIIHKIDHFHFTEPQYSDLKSEISKDVGIYLSDQIELNRDHQFARNAVFTNASDDSLSLQVLADQLLKENRSFVPQSQKIALRLFDSINNDKRIHRGDLALCTFSERNSDKWLALLKMDPQDSFITVEKNVGGKRQYVLEKVADVMPIGELQKCAFILPAADRARQRDLIVLDQQQARYGAGRMVASFFSNNFLQCKVGLNERELTQGFLGLSSDWIDGKKGILEDEEISEFKDALQSHSLRKTINIAHFAQAAIEEPDLQEEYLKKVVEGLRAEKLQDLVFKPDPSVIKRPQILHLLGDNNLKISIASDAVGPGKTLDYNKDESLNYWVIEIKTTNLNLVHKQ